jgi:hypothetical protein
MLSRFQKNPPQHNQVALLFSQGFAVMRTTIILCIKQIGKPLSLVVALSSGDGDRMKHDLHEGAKTEDTVRVWSFVKSATHRERHREPSLTSFFQEKKLRRSGSSPCPELRWE